MKNIIQKSAFILSAIILMSCTSRKTVSNKAVAYPQNSIETGADQLSLYLPLLKGKKVGLMGNQTTVVGASNAHLVDVLLKESVDLKFAFAPEHGFRGDVERGEKVSNNVDLKTGLPLYTLYGGNEKQDSIMQSIDVMIFDLQDVGARFYTYIIIAPCHGALCKA